jgi:hypothetical protein
MFPLKIHMATFELPFSSIGPVSCIKPHFDQRLAALTVLAPVCFGP